MERRYKRIGVSFTDPCAGKTQRTHADMIAEMEARIATGGQKQTQSRSKTRAVGTTRAERAAASAETYRRLEDGLKRKGRLSQ